MCRKRFAHVQQASLPRSNDFLRDFVSRQSEDCKAAEPGQRLIFLVHALRDPAGASANERS